MLRYEKKAYKNGAKIVAGIDEAGRGPLAGPVVAAAVILPREVPSQDTDRLEAAHRTAARLTSSPS